MVEIKLIRAYEAPEKSDGFRVLSDRLWPRGLKKEEVPYNLWPKDIAPSTELREWFHADTAARWPEFEKRYTAELEHNPDLPDYLAALKGHPVITLVFGAKDTEHNQADVLKDFLEKKL